ncbi:alpha/beta hydrolase [Jeotgalicoccus nanhaiensis]|uniref:Alpha/beta hydrolase n=1 Tax=Jeotgalicoccus nanhaiensis TaxID=568603 RepID=A0ABR9XUV6_9STAP|nr:alpha/beta hydrolase [Jeotgalicoccus nanhaiensis]MBF0752642.1 alpha/beta hydrolase [Jeotgalicoccus nanhaiensis]TFU62815.1 alpha/beta hydrolase [Jeotgalicoccus nanhaiensis]
MKIINRTMKNKDRSISVTHYAPKKPKASIQILHGMADHKGRYKEFLMYLALNDIHCVIHNHRGHGSDEKLSNLGHFSSFEDLLEDAKIVSRSMPGDLPHIGLGHSMGSILLRRLLEEELYDAGVIVGTGSKVRFSDTLSHVLMQGLSKVIPGTKSRLINKLSFLGYDGNFKGTVKNRWLSADDDNIHAYNTDPHAGQKMSVRALAEILKNIRYVDSSKCLKRYRDIPYLLIGGMDDPFSHFGRDYELLNWRLQRHFNNVKMELVPNARHEVLFEENRGAVYSNIVKWVETYVEK